MYSHRILYVGDDITLPGSLNKALKLFDCYVVRCPDVAQARVFLQHIEYSLLICDDEAAEAELRRFARPRTLQKSLPVVVLNKAWDLESLLIVVKRELNI